MVDPPVEFVDTFCLCLSPHRAKAVGREPSCHQHGGCWVSALSSGCRCDHLPFAFRPSVVRYGWWSGDTLWGEGGGDGKDQSWCNNHKTISPTFSPTFWIYLPAIQTIADITLCSGWKKLWADKGCTGMTHVNWYSVVRIKIPQQMISV